VIQAAAIVLCLLVLVSACKPADSADRSPLEPEPGEELSGGETTVFDTTANAFSLPARNLEEPRKRSFFVGNSFFKQNWVIAPASASDRDGLGPLFNARSCSTCHLRDGRGLAPEPGEDFTSMLVRVSRPGRDEKSGVVAHPVYGDQIQNFAIPGASPEAKPIVEYEEVAGTYPDGTAYSLRRPSYRFEDWKYGDPGEDLLISPRVAPHMVGMGLLEAIPEEAIESLADPGDADGDGISGRMNRVWDEQSGTQALGRFGWKAGQPTVRQQVAGAFRGDIGITSTLFATENHSAGQKLDALAATEPEIADRLLDHVTFYSATLAVPARRDVDDPIVLKGKKIFGEIGCADCHVPTFRTGDSPEFPELSDQVIHPYTDLLLHDMGEDLADGRPEFEASGREWRTPPLWGLGLVQTVNGHSTLLHDGRARNFEEAILWHGGEAEASRDAFMKLPEAERQAVIRFLESL